MQRVIKTTNYIYMHELSRFIFFLSLWNLSLPSQPALVTPIGGCGHFPRFPALFWNFDPLVPKSAWIHQNNENMYLYI